MIQNSCGADKRQKSRLHKGNGTLGTVCLLWGLLSALKNSPSNLILGDVTRKLLKALKLEGVADQIDKLMTGTYLSYPQRLGLHCDIAGNQHCEPEVNQMQKG